ncbi:MAG: organic solvent tolerance protein OstA [Bacteroidia bacterium]|nr:organic solvent tolerance protein OstA [Bacteroidia bacterium]
MSQKEKPTKIELIHADSLDYNKEVNKNVRRLIGNVSFKHENAIMNCDSAYLYAETNSMEAFSNISINQGDTVSLKGDHLNYDGNSSLAIVTGNVILTDKKMILTTDQLNYNRHTGISSYTTGGKIVDSENTLTSKLGFYDSFRKEMHFKTDVVLTNPRYVMRTDTMNYNTFSHTAFFFGPTTITSKENFIYCERGFYNTEKEISGFTNNAYIKTQTQKLSGDSIGYNRQTGLGRAFRNILISDTVNNILIKGNYSEHNEITEYSLVTERAELIQIFTTDSLFLHADTLSAVSDTLAQKDTSQNKKRTLFAFHNVKFFKTDLQGRCDSLVYSFRDSAIHLFRVPMLWSGAKQMTADSVTLHTAFGNISHVVMRNNSFIVSLTDSANIDISDSVRFDQIRGRNLTGYFNDNKLYKIFVEGNGQTIYYAKNKEEKLTGVNRADCSDIYITVEENKVKEISLVNNPDATFYPLHELLPRELRLKGFIWKPQLRPENREAIFKK